MYNNTCLFVLFHVSANNLTTMSGTQRFTQEQITLDFLYVNLRVNVSQITVCILTCFVMCGCFVNMYVCIYCVLYCLYRVLCCFGYTYLFLLVLSVLMQGLLPPSDNAVAVSK